MPDKPSRSLPPLRRERLYESLAAHISDFIEAQGLVSGDRLPPERQLAAELGVSRATLSRALASLETLGRIEVRHGVGALVRDAGAPSDSYLHEQVETRPRAEVVTARESMLAGLARAAAANPNASLRLAMLADDGRPRAFEHTWRCVRRLAASPLLVDLDDMLADKAPAPPGSPSMQRALDLLAEAVIHGDGSSAAVACIGMLTD